MNCKTCKKELTEENEMTELPDGYAHDNCNHWRDCQACADDCTGQERESQDDRTPPGWDAFCRDFNAGRR